MNDKTIEFQQIDGDLTSPEIVRKSFRIPVENSENVWVELDGKKYSVKDISTGGINVCFEDQSLFSIRQKFFNCKLNLSDVTIEKLKGVVVHISSDSDQRGQCGIQWINTGKESEEKIDKTVSRMKQEFLTH